MKKSKIDRGASFCHDDNIMQDIHEIEHITEGYQKWQGTLPIFSNTEMIKMVDISFGIVE